METVTAADFQRQLGLYQDRALVEPVLVTRNGRDRLVLMSADEYRRLKRRDRELLASSELSGADLAAIASARVPAEFGHLNDELPG
jgi:prevent-host-death family protein